MWGRDISVQNKIFEGILDDIEKLENPQERESLLFDFMKEKNRISDATLLDRVHHMWAKSVFDIMGKVVPSAERKPTPKTFLEVTDLDNNFVLIKIY